MKTSKTSLVLAIVLLLLVNVSVAQDAPSTFVIHTDNVKFEKLRQYEELAKSLKENCEKHEIKEMVYSTISVEDGRFVYVTPIKNMADLDKNSFKELSDKMGKEALDKLLDDMDECYDSHSNKVIHYSADLSYNPVGEDNTGNNREYHFLYYTPKNAKAIKEAIKKVKELHQKKGIKNGYQIYHSGFGSDENYYMVEISGKNELEIAKREEEENKLLGEERRPTMFNVIKLTSRYNQVNGRFRPDLSYTPKK